MDLFEACAVRTAPGKTDTSREAAEHIAPKAQILRSKIVERLRFGATLTADEMAAVLKESPLSIRPRFSELHNLGLIEDSGRRRQNRSGRSAIVWKWRQGAKAEWAE